ncbi:MAG: hypothetical protein IT378_21595 [Sandaracinaceae bacterium]|nr:hypothetical protein [Sandaracinaceae bacterium]
MPRRPSILLFCSALLLCACEPDPRNDAQLFLDRVQRIDLDAPSAERRTLVEALATLPLASEEVRSARNACVEAHRTLLRAETLHVEARDRLRAYENDESRIPITERQRIERAISGSSQALEQSHGLFARCERAKRDLELRYRRRARQ